MFLRSLMVFGLFLALTGDASAAKAKKKKAGTIRGVVTAVESGTDDKKDSGTITVKPHAGKKKKAAVPAGDRKITVSKDTKVEKVSGRRARGEAKPATFTELQNNTRVLVTLKPGSGDIAEKVQIFEKRKKKKAT